MKPFIFSIIILFAVATVTLGRESEISTSYVNKALFYGFDYGDDLVTQALDLEIGKVDVSAAYVRPVNDDDDMQRFDVGAGHSWQIGDVTLRFGFDWLLYPLRDSDGGFDVQALSATIAHETGIRYTMAHLYPTCGASAVESGQVHVLGFERAVGPIILDDLQFAAFADISYNDGFDSLGITIIDDFSHARTGCLGQIIIGPAELRLMYYRQWGLNDVIRDEDVIGLTIALLL